MDYFYLIYTLKKTMIIFYSYRGHQNGNPPIEYVDFQTILRYYKYSRASCYRELRNSNITTIIYPDGNKKILYNWEELKNNKRIWQQLDERRLYRDLNS